MVGSVYDQIDAIVRHHGLDMTALGDGRLASIPFNIRAAVLHSDTFLQPRHQGLESNAL